MVWLVPRMLEQGMIKRSLQILVRILSGKVRLAALPSILLPELFRNAFWFDVQQCC